MKVKQIEEYEVNSCTMFLEPVEYGSKIYTRIIEVDDEFLSPFKPIEIIRNSCDYFGCDYESRKKGTRLLTGIKRKIPIVIEPTNRLFFSRPHHRVAKNAFGLPMIMLKIIIELIDNKHQLPFKIKKLIIFRSLIVR
ncbi:competence protein ComK [Neobacillus pocheonensis]|uniref:Competence protein ComK n=1 Tax=Neobacillus pocheonensis TaxID=363869 RepID=A0ABT0WDV6_9BACI|nr:competence protein ComK [Neobacillus pocheonensis]